MTETMEQARLTEKQEKTIVNFLSANPDFFERHPGILEQPQPQEESVVDYLSGNPDFFEHHPEVLNQLTLTHENGDAVSLIERQVKGLRKELDQTKQNLQELISIGHDNERLNKRMHHLTLKLIDSVDFDECLNTLQDKLHEDFDADAVELHLFTHNEVDGLSNADLDGYRDFLDSASPPAACSTQSS